MFIFQRLTKSVPGDQRDDVIRAYVKNDLLACDMNPSISIPHPADSLSPARELAVASTGDESSVYREAVFRLLKSRTLSAQYLARLFNGMSSVKEGRTYLSLSSELLNEMQLAMKAEARDSLTREMLLGALQKLSLKLASFIYCHACCLLNIIRFLEKLHSKTCDNWQVRIKIQNMR